MINKNDSEEKGTNVSIYLEYDLLEWIDTMVEKKIFANRSHAVQACLFNYKQHVEIKKK